MKVQKCICCNKKVELIWDDLDFLKSATYISIEPEYGSKYDGEIYKFIICDNCITIKSQRNALRFIPQTINPTFFTKIKKYILKIFSKIKIYLKTFSLSP